MLSPHRPQPKMAVTYQIFGISPLLRAIKQRHIKFFLHKCYHRLSVAVYANDIKLYASYNENEADDVLNALNRPVANMVRWAEE